MKNLTSFILTLLTVNLLFGQLSTKKYTRNITNKSENEIAPCLSMDGNTMIFTRKRAMDDGWRTQIVKKENGVWQRAEDFTLLNRHVALGMLGSYCLNKDATQVMFVSKRSGGIGGFDIWTSKLNGTTWSEPENLGKPLNSTLDEINPSFSLDGKSIYFVQTSSNSENGKIFYSTNKGYVWSTPVEIDFGGEFFSAKIAADNQTMYLSKVIDGKTFFYSSKLSKGSWSTPIKIEGINENTDKFFTLDCRSPFLTISFKEAESYDIFQTTLPLENQSTPISDLTITSDEPHRVEIKKTNSNEIIYRGSDLNEFYLLNNDSYTVSVIFKDYYPYIFEVNLENTPNTEKTISPNLVKLEKSSALLIDEFENIEELKSSLLSTYVDALNLMSTSHPERRYTVFIYQSDISLDSLPSYSHNREVKDTISINDGTQQIHTYYSNDKTESLSTIAKECLKGLNEQFDYDIIKVSPTIAKKPKGIYIEQL